MTDDGLRQYMQLAEKAQTHGLNKREMVLLECHHAVLLISRQVWLKAVGA